MPTKWGLDHLCQAPPKTRSEILKCYPRFSFKLAILSCTQAPAPGCIANFGYPNKPAQNLARKKKHQLLTWSFFLNLFFLGARGFANVLDMFFFSPFGGVLAVFSKQTIQTILRWWFFFGESILNYWKPHQWPLMQLQLLSVTPNQRTTWKGEKSGGGAFLDVWEVGCHMANKRVWYIYIICV